MLAMAVSEYTLIKYNKEGSIINKTVLTLLLTSLSINSFDHCG